MFIVKDEKSHHILVVQVLHVHLPPAVTLAQYMTQVFSIRHEDPLSSRLPVAKCVMTVETQDLFNSPETPPAPCAERWGGRRQEGPEETAAAQQPTSINISRRKLK